MVLRSKNKCARRWCSRARIRRCVALKTESWNQSLHENTKTRHANEMKTKYTKEVLQSTTTAATYDHKEMILITRTPYRNYAATEGPAGTGAYERERHHRHLHRREPRKHMKERTDNGRDGCWILLQRLAAAASPIAADSSTTGHMDINDGGDNPVSAKKI